jgi:hypothetical protein
MQRNKKENIEINVKNKDMDDKIKIIDIIIDMYPELKKDKNDIINVVFGKLSKPNKYVFTKIMYNNEELYVDVDGLLLTKNIDFRGFVINNKFYLVSDIDNKDDILDIPELDRIMYN